MIIKKETIFETGHDWGALEAQALFEASQRGVDMVVMPGPGMEQLTLQEFKIRTRPEFHEQLNRQQEPYTKLKSENQQLKSQIKQLKQQIEALQQQPQPTASTPVEETKEQKNERMLRCIHQVMKEGVMTQQNHWQAILCILCDKGYYSQRTDYKGFCQWMQAMADDKHPFVPELNYNSIKKNDDYYKPYAEWKAPKGKKAQEMHNVAQRFKELLEIEEAKTVSIHAA